MPRAPSLQAETNEHTATLTRSDATALIGWSKNVVRRMRVSPHVALPQVTTNDDQDHQVSQG